MDGQLVDSEQLYVKLKILTEEIYNYAISSLSNIGKSLRNWFPNWLLQREINSSLKHMIIQNIFSSNYKMYAGIKLSLVL